MFLSASPVPQTGVRHSIFESLCLGRSSKSIASGFLRLWDSLNFKKDREFVGITVLFLDEKVNFVIHGFTPVGLANHYMPFLKAGSIVKVDHFEVARLFDNLQVIANTNLELPDVVGQIRYVQGSDLADVVGQIRYVQGSDLTRETTRVVIRLLIDL
ncbi:hypothetical protein F2Q70_00004817 [Brassica cretica]|uniref:Uncharacterized protein n=1 Tax=Brassica cretica TaxID=69181 RepID=A0A8S9IQG0_BRACR|nr:hypothetical protein F2Q70_00004817 [Brassica cretica]